MPQLSFRKLSCQSARSKRTLEDDEKVSIYFLFNIDKWGMASSERYMVFFRFSNNVTMVHFWISIWNLCWELLLMSHSVGKSLKKVSFFRFCSEFSPEEPFLTFNFGKTIVWNFKKIWDFWGVIFRHYESVKCIREINLVLMGSVPPIVFLK